MPPTDLVVVLPGIMGSTLRGPDGMVWAPSAGSVLRAVRSFGRSVTRLTLPDGIGDEHPGDGVEPAALMPDLHALPGIWTPVKGYDLLVKRLRSLGYRQTAARDGAPPGNLLPVPYDWRLSNRWNGRRLAGIVEPALERWRSQGGRYADAQVVFVCHSMGGLLARWYVERCGGAEITRKLITLGTPYRGAAKALEQLVNGVHAGIGPLALDLTAFARSLPSLHQLLPEYACVEHAGTLAKTTEIDVPDLSAARAADALGFHTELREAEARRPASLAATHAIVGIQQHTPTTVRLDGGRVVPVDTYRSENLFGDATVPLVAASRGDVPLDSNTLRRVPDKHGNLQRNRAALDELEGIFSARDVVVRAPETVHLRVEVPELVTAGHALPVRVTAAEGRRQAVHLTVTGETGQVVQARPLLAGGQPTDTTVEDLPPGAYTVTVAGPRAGSPIAPVSSDVLVWG